MHEQVFTPAIVRDHALYEFGYSLKAGYNSNLFNTLKPDAYDVKRRTIWELKPRTWITGSNRTKALKQVLSYTSTATSKSAENWEAGLSSKLLPLDVKVNQYRGDTFYEITFFKDPIDDRSGLVFYRFKVLN